MRNPRARVDSNQPEIVAALRKAGCKVQHMHTIGDGCPDLLVGKDGINYVFEVKAPGGSLTLAELEWLAEWRGTAYVVYSAEQAIEIITGGNTK
jgi:Holliday junction resolvase